MGSGFSKKKKQAKAFQDQLMQMQQKMSEAEVEGIAANGLVTVTITGEHQVKAVNIKPECVDPEDVEGLEDLLKTAFNDAQKKLAESSGQGMPDLGALGGLGGLGGMPF